MMLVIELIVLNLKSCKIYINEFRLTKSKSQDGKNARP